MNIELQNLMGELEPHVATLCTSPTAKGNIGLLLEQYRVTERVV